MAKDEIMLLRAFAVAPGRGISLCVQPDQPSWIFLDPGTGDQQGRKIGRKFNLGAKIEHTCDFAPAIRRRTIGTTQTWRPLIPLGGTPRQTILPVHTDR